MRKIKAIFDRTEGDWAILNTADQKELRIPKNSLPSARKGENFSIEIKTEEEAKSSDEKLAKVILNEILKNS
jgi:hypothetical protein